MGKREIIDPKLITVKPEIYALLDPYHKALADVLQERGEVRMITAPEAPDKKPVPVLERSVVNSLGLFHRAAAEVMEKRGMILVIEDTKPGEGHGKFERGSQIFTVPAEVFAQLDPIEKIIIRRQAERGEVRILEPAVDKNVAVFQASSIRAMSPMAQEVAKMLEDKSYIKIVESTTETPKRGRHKRVNSCSKNPSIIEASQREVSFFERNFPVHHTVLMELVARGEARILPDTTEAHQLLTIPDSIKKQRKIVEVYPKVKV